MARVILTSVAKSDLARLIGFHLLPATTPERVRTSLRKVADHPMIGRALTGAGEGYRLILGPWPWMLLVYRVDLERDIVFVMTIQDARRAGSVTTGR